MHVNDADIGIHKGLGSDKLAEDDMYWLGSCRLDAILIFDLN